MQTSTKGFIAPLLLAIIAVLVLGGGYYYVQKTKTSFPIVTETQQLVPEVPVPLPAPVSTSTVSWNGRDLQVLLPNFDRECYSSVLLYQEDENTFYICTSGTEGRMAIIEKSPSSRRETGFRFGPFEILSPDNRRFVSVEYNGREQLCINQIDSVSRCVSPSHPDETFSRRLGDYDMLGARGRWLDNDKFEFSVFNKDPKTFAGANENSMPIRKEILSFDAGGLTPNSTVVQDETANWNTYTDARYGFSFQHPSSLVFQPIRAGTNQPVVGVNEIGAEIKSGLPNEPHIDSVLISIGIDNTKSSYESCMPETYTIPGFTKSSVAKQVQAGDNLFYRYIPYAGCGGLQCSGADLYTIWHNNTCYYLESSYSADYLRKMFGCSLLGPSGLSESCGNESDYPKYLSANQSQQTSIKYIDGLVEQILSTFKFTN